MQLMTQWFSVSQTLHSTAISFTLCKNVKHVNLNKPGFQWEAIFLLY